ncbi:MAG TPA: hypothetical protein DCE41_08475 [Cytophagales bacterium]|nr:hypothetical protein [Cytophagales bacterium]HAA24106.1 hypothetical protein [Cytophagales bacterium]HAP57972.1 hypothetical protein [Cytophagales bacterium]
MGVDVGIKFRLIANKSEVEQEIEVSDQDNSLASILDGSTEIKYTSISLKEDKFLTSEEFEKIKLNYNPEEEMIMSSQEISIEEALSLFNKLFNYTYRRSAQSLVLDLEDIDQHEIASEKRLKRKENRITDYIGFQYSMGVAVGILKLAIKTYSSVQIIAEYY